jgi:hypothetical protein
VESNGIRGKRGLEYFFLRPCRLRSRLNNHNASIHGQLGSKIKVVDLQSGTVDRQLMAGIYNTKYAAWANQGVVQVYDGGHLV